MIEKIVLHRAPEPFIHRYAKADLRPLQYLRGQQAFHGLAQDPLRGAPAHPHVVRERGNKGSQFMVHEGHACFQRSRHGHAITTLQQVIRQPAGLVETQDASQGRVAPLRYHHNRR